MKASDFAKISRELVDVALGRKSADLVIRNGRWVCVQSGEIIPHTDIAIFGERIAYVGPDASHTIGEQTQLIEANNRYLSPGLLDGHMHVESGMLTVTEFVRAVIPLGTTAMFIDPHEIANIFGIKGVKLMSEEAALQPIHVWVQVPSCVPSAPGFETPGATIGPDEIAQALRWENVIGLGEMMNFPGVINSDANMHQEMGETRAAQKVIGGHYASPDIGIAFHGYAAGGPEDDHEGTRAEDAVARIRQGMKAMLRYGSGWLDVSEGVRAITEMGLDSRRFILCTDDLHSETLISEGHINRAVKQAITHGVSPMTAIQMATINTAEHFGLSRDLGMIAPGRFADILILSNLAEFVIDQVIVKGKLAAEAGKILIDIPTYDYPAWALDSVKLKHSLTEKDFVLPAPNREQVTAHVIGVIENQAPTKHLKVQLKVHQQEVKPDLDQDIAKIALVERHKATGKIQVGLVHGFGFNTACAIASTVAHDSHHLIVVGTRESDMALAANQLAKIGGGQIVVKDGQVIGQVALPIAGLMSNSLARDVAAQAASVLEGFRQCGCSMNNPNMQLSLLALVVIPELRISDLGLVDVSQFRFIPVIE
jgi:adenine deaminase